MFGTPVSFQRSNAIAKNDWKELVRSSSIRELPEMHFATDQKIAVTLYYYPEHRMAGDVDNIVKLTLDAMSQHLYVDDEQVERVVVQKFESDRVFAFQDPTPTLAACMLGSKPALYIRVSTDPHEDL